MKRFPAEVIRAQIRSVLGAWGFPDDHAETSSEIMTETDLRGVDSHGISMLASYEKQIAKGHIRVGGEVRLVRETASTALADPAQAEVPVITIAMDAGFASLGPFNRAFKATTGVTPTEYRRQRGIAA